MVALGLSQLGASGDHSFHNWPSGSLRLFSHFPLGEAKAVGLSKGPRGRLGGVWEDWEGTASGPAQAAPAQQAEPAKMHPHWLRVSGQPRLPACPPLLPRIYRPTVANVNGGDLTDLPISRPSMLVHPMALMKLLPYAPKRVEERLA